MPDVKSSNSIAFYSTSIADIKKLWQESNDRIKSFDRINDDLVS